MCRTFDRERDQAANHRKDALNKRPQTIQTLTHRNNDEKKAAEFTQRYRSDAVGEIFLN